MTAADLIDRAIAVINERGWCQDVLYNEAGQVCGVGALRTAAFGFPHGCVGANRAVYLTAAKAVRDNLQCGECSLQEFNDAEGRTQEEVVDLMAFTATWLRAVTP